MDEHDVNSSSWWITQGGCVISKRDVVRGLALRGLLAVTAREAGAFSGL